MTDYTKNANFNAKTGTTIEGAAFDSEFDEIATAIASKQDTADKGSASGYCGLDGTGLVDPTDLPAATATAQGAVELATTAEVVTGTDTSRAVTAAGVEAWGAQNAGMVQDIANLSDPNDDRLLGWDDSAGAVIGFDLGTGLTSSGTSLTTNDSAIAHDSLSGFVADEHVAHSGVTMTAGAGLSGGGTIAATRTFELDFSTLGSGIAGASMDAADRFSVYDDSAADQKYMVFSDAGIPTSTITGTSDTLATADLNRVLRYTSGSAVAVTLNTGVGRAGNIIVIMQAGAGQVTVGGTATVVGSIGLKTRTQYSVCVLYCFATDNWVMYGDCSA